MEHLKDDATLKRLGEKKHPDINVDPQILLAETPAQDDILDQIR